MYRTGGTLDRVGDAIDWTSGAVQTTGGAMESILVTKTGLAVRCKRLAMYWTELAVVHCIGPGVHWTGLVVSYERVVVYLV